MIVFRVRLILVLAVANAAGWYADQSTAAEPNSCSLADKTIVLVGDSLTEQAYFDKAQRGQYPGTVKWADMLAQETGMQVINRGVGGSNSAEHAPGNASEARWLRWMDDQADVFWFAFYGNEVGTHSADELTDNLESMISVARNRGAVSLLATAPAVDWCPDKACTYWAGSRDPNLVREYYNDAIRRLADLSQDVYLVDIFQAFRRQIDSGVPSADCYRNPGRQQPCPGDGRTGLQLNEWNPHVSPLGSRVYAEEILRTLRSACTQALPRN